MSLLLPVEKSFPPPFTHQELEGSSKEEYEKCFQFKYLFSLEFAKEAYLKKVQRLCQKADKKKQIPALQKWQGAYYHKEILSPFAAPVCVSYIDEKIGYGVFAKQKLFKGAFIGEYLGLIRKYKPKIHAKNSYCFEYVIGGDLETSFTIDAQDQGNFTRFINHHPDGNCDPIFVFHQGIMKMILITNRGISKGEEITYDYGPDYWGQREAPIV